MAKSEKNIFTNIAVTAVAICGLVMLSFGIILNNLGKTHAATVSGGSELLVFSRMTNLEGSVIGYAVQQVSPIWPSNGDKVNLTIPSTYNDGTNGLKSVIAIANSAFREINNLVSVTLPDSILTISSSAFNNCSSLTSISIPDTVKLIGTFAFSGCTSLKSVTLGRGITTISYAAFSGCTSLIYAEIPDSVTSIDEWAFSDCTALTNVDIPDSIENIGSHAFSSCTSLKSIKIPEGIETINEYTFNNCQSLASVEFPDSLIKIENNTFYNCAFTNIKIPDNVTSIGGVAFAGCKFLTNIEIPDGVSNIGTWAFANCISLKDITIPNGVTSIGSRVFEGCTSLKRIIFPYSLTDMGAQVVSQNMTENLKIYVIGHEYAPSGWDANWNRYGATVVWNWIPTTEFDVKIYGNIIEIIEPELDLGVPYSYIWYYVIQGESKVVIADHTSKTFEYDQKGYTITYVCEVYEEGNSEAVFTVEKTVFGVTTPPAAGPGTTNGNFKIWMMAGGGLLILIALIFLTISYYKNRKNRIRRTKISY